MRDLFKNISENYNIKIETINQLGITTINDIFLFENNGKKYIIKIYNVDEEKQVKNSLKTQKYVYDSLGIAPDVIVNKENKLYTNYKNKFYAIQEYIQEEKNIKIDSIKESSKNLALLHKRLEELDESTYKNKKECKNYRSIKENVEQSKNILNKIEIEEYTKHSFEKLLNKREKFLEKYKCEYNPRECQVIHRDIRPSNIIINNKVYFIDFDYVAYGDLIFEIGSAAMLISNFKIDETKEFLKIYNLYTEKKYTNEYIFKNLLEYYVQSDFPIKLVNKVKNDTLIGFIENRIKCLEFCEKIVYK